MTLPTTLTHLGMTYAEVGFDCGHTVLYPRDWEGRADKARKPENVKYWNEQSAPLTLGTVAACPRCKGVRGTFQTVISLVADSL